MDDNRLIITVKLSWMISNVSFMVNAQTNLNKNWSLETSTNIYVEYHSGASNVGEKM